MSIGELSSKLKDRIQQDREELESIARHEFENLQQSLSRSSQDALNTIEADIAAKTESLGKAIATQLQGLSDQTTTLRKSLAKTWLRTTVLGFCLLMGLILGTWGLSSMMSAHIINQWQQIKALQVKERQLKETVSNLEQQTWGIQLMQNGDNRFIILPPKATIHEGWSFKNRKALKLE